MSLAGDYVTSRRWPDSIDAKFIRERLNAKVPHQHIAQMAGCSLSYVKHLARLMEEPAPPEPEALAPVIPLKPKLLLSLYRGAIPKPVTMHGIAEQVAVEHELSLDELRGHSRKQCIVYARQYAMWRIHQTGRYSLPQIGRYFGKDHTTVLHGVNAHARRMEQAA